ncbi:MAG: radical SAM protein [Phycisphaerales bacterium]|nr:radical SAM protein [Phycisphaerales bacterium]
MNSRSILLINANRMRPPVAPLALDYVGDHLYTAGFEVHLLDLCFAENPVDSIRHKLANFDPLAVGISFRNTDDCYLFSQAWFVPQLAELVTLVRSLTAAPIILGGCGFSIFPAPIMDYVQADFGVVGDGEETMRRLMSALRDDRDYRKIAGLAWRDATGRVVVNPPCYTSTLDIPPSRGMLDNLRYLHEGAMSNIETKRGCPMPCIYCADPAAKGTALRVRDPRQVADELETLLARGIDVFHICDGEFNIPAEHALAVCEAIRDCGLGERIRWYAYASIQPFSAELAEAMRRAGCVGINFGADSGCDRMLAALRRGYRSADIRQTVEHCRRAGITVMLDLLLGGPGEDEASIRETIELIKSVDPDRAGAATGLRVYPGTALAELVRQQGPMPRNRNLHGCVEDNDNLLRPIFFIEQQLGDDPFGLIVDLIDGDERFFPPSRKQDAANYNYNDNKVLENAIAAGARGAFWDILRKLADSSPRTS